MPPSHIPPPRDPEPTPGPLRRVLASLDPQRDDSPLRRMLRRAGITGPFDPSTTPTPPPPTTSPSPDQENPTP